MQIRLIRFGAAMIAVFLLAVSCPSWLSAQTNTTSLSGTVTDATGAVISEATVTISNQA